MLFGFFIPEQLGFNAFYCMVEFTSALELTISINLFLVSCSEIIMMLDEKGILPLKAKWAAFPRKAARTKQHIHYKSCHIKVLPQMV